MNYKNANITAIKDDIVKRKIVITVEVDRSQENLETAEELERYSGKTPQDVEVVITPRQMPLMDVLAKAEFSTSYKPEEETEEE